MLDPITLEVLKHAFVSAAEEETAVLSRTAYSRNVRERIDYSTTISDAQGRLVAQALRVPIHLGGMAPCVKTILAEYGDDLAEGDIFLSNDPYSGGQHPPDVQVTYPIFHAGRLLAFGCALAHHEDVGGRVPSGMSTRSQEVYEEGLRLHHVRLYRKGELADGVLRLITYNVRYPETTLGDLRAQIAAVKTGAGRILEMVAKYGEEVVRQAMSDLMDLSERRMRESLATIPTGKYEWEDHLDNDGLTTEPCTIRAAVQVDAAGLAIDFTGTSPQGRGSVNSSLTATHSAVYFASRALCDPDIMQNEGCVRPVSVVAPEGTLVNPRFPAACSARTTVAHRIVDCIFGALAGVVPRRVETATYGTSPAYVVFARGGVGRRWFYMDANHGSAGARLLHDGNDGSTSKTSNSQNMPLETIEVRVPIRFVRYGFVADSGGPGRRRGGLALERAWQVLAPGGAHFEARGDRQLFPPWGLQNGQPGRPSRVTILRPDGTRRELPVSCSVELDAGDTCSLVTAGAGGFGPPLEREPDLVLQDVLDEKVSPKGAREDYGVVIADGRLDREATLALRASRIGSGDTASQERI
jgi:N-methylhydantoinase B